jgi:hypothetical protein
MELNWLEEIVTEIVDDLPLACSNICMEYHHTLLATQATV